MSGPPTEFDAPRFPVAAALLDPRRGAAEAAARRRDAGFMEGYEAGLRQAEAEVAGAIADHRRSASRLIELTNALELAVAELANRDEVALADIEADVVALAVELASELVGRELAVVDRALIDALERVIGLVPERGQPTVFVHPADESTAREAIAADVVRWPETVIVRADPGIERGGCVVEVDACRIDGQIGPALDRLRRAIEVEVGRSASEDVSSSGPATTGAAATAPDLLAPRVDSAQSES